MSNARRTSMTIRAVTGLGFAFILRGSGAYVTKSGMDERALRSTANLASYRAWQQLGLKTSGLAACGSCSFVVTFILAVLAPFVRLGAANDARLFILRLSALMGLALVFTIVPLTVGLIRFVSYKRRHPWTPPNGPDPDFGRYWSAASR
jgi:hypothetical protein